MTYERDNILTLAGRDWVKLAIAGVLQGAALLVTSYVAVSVRVAVVETELRYQRDLFEEKLNTLRVEMRGVVRYLPGGGEPDGGS